LFGASGYFRRKRLNNNGVLIGTSYVSRGGRNVQHVAVWRA
jgi:hypothetical protein